MFVILRGSVDIVIEKYTSIGVVKSTVTSMYDGSDFGALSMMGTMLKNKVKRIRDS
jgi:hypothetical protein